MMTVITGLYPSQKILLVLYSYKLLSNIYTTHQLTYFLYYLHQGNFKNRRIKKIQQVHQKLQAKQSFIILLNLFSIYITCIFQGTWIFR